MLDRPQGMWREVAFAAVLAVLLPVSLLLEYWQAALLTGFVAAGLFGLRGWFRFNPARSATGGAGCCGTGSPTPACPR